MSAGKPRRWFITALVVLLIGILCLLALVRLLTPSWPTYGEKGIGEWFEIAVMRPSQGWSRSSTRAFEEMGAEAVPFLARWANARFTPFHEIYASVCPRLPDWLRRVLPRPRTYTYFHDRQVRALILLREIAAAQRRKSGNGKDMASLILPAIQTALRDPSSEVRKWAAEAVVSLGSQAAAIIPDLLKLTQDTNDGPASSAMSALGSMGCVASNAVPVLIRNAANATGTRRLFAVQSLGEIGRPAQSAVPVLVSVLLSDDSSMPPNLGGGEELRVKAARALAEIGITPEEAVPTLIAMTRGTNQWARWFASVALWNRARQNPILQAQVIEGLRSTNRIGVMISLGCLGSNAAAFVPEICRLTNDSFSGHTARRILQRIQPNLP